MGWMCNNCGCSNEDLSIHEKEFINSSTILTRFLMQQQSQFNKELRATLIIRPNNINLVRVELNEFAQTGSFVNEELDGAIYSVYKPDYTG